MVTVELLLKTLMKIYCDPNMTVELINSGGDHRGKILFFKSGNLKEFMILRRIPLLYLHYLLI